MNIEVESTTDSKEAVDAAMGVKPVETAKEETKPASEQESKDQSDETAEESEASVGEDAENKSNDDDGEEPEEKEDSTEGDGKPKKRGGFKKRIDKLNRRLSEKEQALSQKDQEIAHWRNLAEGRDGGKKTEEKPVQKEADSQEGKPKPEDFETHGEYVEKLAEWKYEQKEKESEKRSREKSAVDELEQRVSKFQAESQKFAEKHPDFRELVDDVDDVIMPPAVRDLVLDSSAGPELLYELAKNREDYERICKLPALAAARELGKIEARLAGKSTASPEKPEVKKTKAPPPITPIVGKDTAVTKKHPDDMDYDEYKKWRESTKSKG